MIIKTENIPKYIDILNEYSTEEVLKWAADKGNVVLSSAFGSECQVLLDMIQKNSLDIQIFTLDTGRLFSETYDLISKTEKHYNNKIKVYFPNSADVEEMVSKSGVNLFYKSIGLRKECCRIRKLLPLERALEGMEYWITGLRKEQSETRDNMRIIELDHERNIVKINPLINWTEDQIWDYIRQHNVPYNPLHDQGYPSVGCACCTRRVQQGDHLRSGRWWWEKPEHKECGLHIENGKTIRGK
jgi:phosphoadenosine phosphosulfate reductase